MGDPRGKMGENYGNFRGRHIETSWKRYGVKTLVPSEPQRTGKCMFIPLKMVLIGIDPYPYHGYLGKLTVRRCFCLNLRRRNFQGSWETPDEISTLFD